MAILDAPRRARPKAWRSENPKAGDVILVEPDDTASLARAIFSLWKDPALLELLGKRGVEGVREHYSAARMTARALEVYGTIAAQV